MMPEEQNRARVERQLQYVATLLQTGERVLWSGQPSVWVVVQRVLPQSAFGVFFVGALVFMVCMVIRRVGLSGFSLSGSAVAPWIVLPILVMMVVVVVSLLITGIIISTGALIARRRAVRTLYVLTDRRALVVRESPFGHECIREFRLENPERVVAVHSDGGISTIAFDRSHAPLLWSMRSMVAPDWFIEGFVGIADGIEVEKLVLDPMLRAVWRNPSGELCATEQRVEKGPQPR